VKIRSKNRENNPAYKLLKKFPAFNLATGIP